MRQHAARLLLRQRPRPLPLETLVDLWARAQGRDVVPAWRGAVRGAVVHALDCQMVARRAAAQAPPQPDGLRLSQGQVGQLWDAVLARDHAHAAEWWGLELLLDDVDVERLHALLRVIEPWRHPAPRPEATGVPPAPTRAFGAIQALAARQGVATQLCVAALRRPDLDPAFVQQLLAAPDPMSAAVAFAHPSLSDADRLRATQEHARAFAEHVGRLSLRRAGAENSRVAAGLFVLRAAAQSRHLTPSLVQALAMALAPLAPVDLGAEGRPLSRVLVGVGGESLSVDAEIVGALQQNPCLSLQQVEQLAAPPRDLPEVPGLVAGVGRGIPGLIPPLWRALAARHLQASPAGAVVQRDRLQLFAFGVAWVPAEVLAHLEHTPWWPGWHDPLLRPVLSVLLAVPDRNRRLRALRALSSRSTPDPATALGGPTLDPGLPAPGLRLVP